MNLVYFNLEKVIEFLIKLENYIHKDNSDLNEIFEDVMKNSNANFLKNFNVELERQNSFVPTTLKYLSENINENHDCTKKNHSGKKIQDIECPPKDS